MPNATERKLMTDAGTDEALLMNTAWELLRSDIVSGTLAPNTRLRIANLRDTYGIGSTPLREALSRLVSDGFVVSLERRGFMVAPISLTDLRELTDLRKLLEKEALRQSLMLGDERWEASVIAAFYRLEKLEKEIRAGEETRSAEWEPLNQEFHETLVAACPSERLKATRRSVYLGMIRYRRVCLSLGSLSRNVHEEHVQLKDAAIARDIAKAEALIDAHLEQTFDRIAQSGRFKS
jgi:DNA-binding GntR family transcriptional regulator